MRVDYLVREVKDHFLKYPDIKILLQSAESSWFGHLDFSNTLKKPSALSVGGTERYIFDNICFPDGKEDVTTSVTEFLYSYGVALIQTGVAYARRQDELLEQKVPKKPRLQDDLLEQKVPAILLSHKKYFESEGHFKLKLFDREKMIKYLEEEKALNYFEKNMDAFIFFQMICSYASAITISLSQLFKIFKDLNNYYKEEDWPFILDMLKDSREAFLDKGDRTLLNKIINCVIIPGELTEEILEEIKQRKIRSASLNSKIEAAESSSFGLR